MRLGQYEGVEVNELVPAGRASRRESAPVEQKLVTGRDGDAHWRGGFRKGHLSKLSPGLPSNGQDLRSRVLRLTHTDLLVRFPCPCAGRSRSCAGPFRCRGD